MTSANLPAFPTPSGVTCGLSRRDLFAAFAMHGLLTNPVTAEWSADDIGRKAVQNAKALVCALDDDDRRRIEGLADDPQGVLPAVYADDAES